MKKCLLKAAEIVCPEKHRAFADLNLKRNTVADRISDLLAYLDSQLKRRIKSFIAFYVAIDKSTDITDVAQLAGVDDTLTITEEFVELLPMMDTTTAVNIFTAQVDVLDRVGVDLSHAVSKATDGAPSMIVNKAGVVTKFREKVQTANGGRDFGTFHCILHQEALSCKALKMDNIVKVVVQTVNFIQSRGLNHCQFDSILQENGPQLRAVIPHRGAVLRRKLNGSCKKKGKPVLEFSVHRKDAGPCLDGGCYRAPE